MIAAAPTTPAPPTPVAFAVVRAAVSPHHAYVAGAPVRVRVRYRSTGSGIVRVAVRSASGRLVRRFDRRVAAAPGGALLRVAWAPTSAADGRYRITAGLRGSGRSARLGTVTLHGHAYPVRGAHSFRGAIGLFGAPRNGGRRHNGFDIVASCGTPVVAARGGVVVTRRYDPVLYGNLAIVRGAGERRDYWYAHLRTPARVRRGQRVRTAQRLGDVGATGNARTVGCHLHFELHGPGGPFDPLPALRAWDAFS